MSAMIRTGIASRSVTGSHWSHVKRSIVEWQRRMRSRNELTTLRDGSLRDIGISRCDAEFEASKPFWLA